MPALHAKSGCARWVVAAQSFNDSCVPRVRQVHLAQLDYQLPRLTRMWTHCAHTCCCSCYILFCVKAVAEKHPTTGLAECLGGAAQWRGRLVERRAAWERSR